MVKLTTKALLVALLTIFCTAAAFADKAPDLVDSFQVSALGFSVDGVLIVSDADGDGQYDTWKVKGTIDGPLGMGGPFEFGGTFIIAGGSGGINDNELPIGVSIGGLKINAADIDNISFEIELLDSQGKGIGVIKINEYLTRDYQALVFIYPGLHRPAACEASVVDLGINVLSSSGNRLEFEANSPYDRGVDLYLYDVMGNLVSLYKYCDKGYFKVSFDNLIPGTYFIYSPISNQSAKKVVVTE